MNQQQLYLILVIVLMIIFLFIRKFKDNKYKNTFFLNLEAILNFDTTDKLKSYKDNIKANFPLYQRKYPCYYNLKYFIQDLKNTKSKNTKLYCEQLSKKSLKLNSLISNISEIKKIEESSKIQLYKGIAKLDTTSLISKIIISIPKSNLNQKIIECYLDKSQIRQDKQLKTLKNLMIENCNREFTIYIFGNFVKPLKGRYNIKPYKNSMRFLYIDF